MKRKELILKFISFFESKGHKRIVNSSLVPENDPTVLFTTAGMHPLVPFLLGEKHQLGKRLVGVQRCIRTVDIDAVGDETHHTFFEMLGNWSLGDYFKDEAIEFSFEFLTEVLELSKERLALSVFEGDKDSSMDEESFKKWISLGVSEDKILYLPKEDIGGDLRERRDLVDLIPRCFIGSQKKQFLKNLIQKIRTGLKFGMMS